MFGMLKISVIFVMSINFILMNTDITYLKDTQGVDPCIPLGVRLIDQGLHPCEMYRVDLYKNNFVNNDSNVECICRPHKSSNDVPCQLVAATNTQKVRNEKAKAKAELIRNGCRRKCCICK